MPETPTDRELMTQPPGHDLTGPPLFSTTELPSEVADAVRILRHDMDQEHGGDHIVDAAELRVLLDWVSPRG